MSAERPEQLKPRRRAISTMRRFEVFKRDGFTCQYCGAHPPAVLLHVDHIVAVAEGGGSEDDNLTTACSACNLGKGARSLKAVPQSLKSKAAEVAEREAQLLGYHNIMQARRDRIENEVWNIAETMTPGCGENGFSRRYMSSIKMFLEKLPYHDVLDAMEIARAKKPWSDAGAFRYFCGICWKKIKGE
jgi:hypothetical protein